jgi:hypothetical protein
MVIMALGEQLGSYRVGWDAGGGNIQVTGEVRRVADPKRLS